MTGQRVLSWNGRVWVETPGPLAGRLSPPKLDGAIVAASSDGSGTTAAVGEPWIGMGDEPRSVAFRRAAGVWSSSPLPPGTTGVKAVWARGASDVWLAGAKGLILHWDGRAWNRESSGTEDTLVAIHGAGRFVWSRANAASFFGEGRRDSSVRSRHPGRVASELREIRGRERRGIRIQGQLGLDAKLVEPLVVGHCSSPLLDDTRQVSASKTSNTVRRRFEQAAVQQLLVPPPGVFAIPPRRSLASVAGAFPNASPHARTACR